MSCRGRFANTLPTRVWSPSWARFSGSSLHPGGTVRYRVDLAERPDGLYAGWHGQVCHAQRSTTDGAVLLTALAGDEAPEDFDTEYQSSPAKIVPEAEAATFNLQTHCLFADEIYRIAPGGEPNELTLRWTGQDERQARQLGLDEFSTT